ncbi:MAG: glycosyltransferase [Candidatus Micrarchaeia archaeon]
MDLSVVITTKNRKQRLLDCLDSIFQSERTGFSFEVIVIDDFSNDGTEKLGETTLQRKFHFPNLFIRHEKTPLKMVKARNLGARLAKGKYILFIDDDNVIHPTMIGTLFKFAKDNLKYGIVGPSMYLLHNKKKYLDYQKINLFNAKTTGFIGKGAHKAYLSDGIPNVFLVKREVFEKCGYFDERLIQTFTEPDFSLNAKIYGFETAMCPKAITYHDIPAANEPGRSIGSVPAKAYCLIRNRFVIVKRYGNTLNKLVFILFFSWVWLLIYSFLALREGRRDLVPLYFAGFQDGLYFFLTNRFRSNIQL